MIRIGHAALYVADLEGAKEFFATYFGPTIGAKYHNQNTGFQSYFLSFEGGCRLEIMTRPGLVAAENDTLRIGYAHIAFSLGSMEAVDALTCRLRQDGYAVLSGPRATGDGYYESCIAGPEGIQIEITV